jgi:hypothetical protein
MAVIACRYTISFTVYQGVLTSSATVVINAYNYPPVAILVGGSRLLSLADPAAEYNFDASRSFAYGKVKLLLLCSRFD